MSAPVMNGAIYVASKAVAHGPMWRARRAAGWPIISTWIDETDPEMMLDWPDLWGRCLREAAAADVLIVYHEAGEVLKGAFIEVGVALAQGTPVIAVGMDEYTITQSGKILIAQDLDAAFELASKFLKYTPEPAVQDDDKIPITLAPLEWRPLGVDALVSAIWRIQAEGHEILLFERQDFRPYHPNIQSAKEQAEVRRKQLVTLLTGRDAINAKSETPTD